MSHVDLLMLAIVGCLIGAILLIARRFNAATAERDQLKRSLEELKSRFKGVVDADEERARVLSELEKERASQRTSIAHDRTEAVNQLEEFAKRTQAEAALAANLTARVSALQSEFAALDEEANLQSFGFYKPRYDFADSAHYEAELESIRAQQKQLLKDKTAAVCAVEWTVGESRADGRKFTNQMLKLMLRAFNGECDAAITKVKYNNVHVMEARIRKAFEVINGLAEVQRNTITPRYLELKLEELFLVHEYEEKLQAEKEEQRRIREQMRDEEIAQREIEKAKTLAEKDEERYQQALVKARAEVESAVGAKQQRLAGEIEDLQRKLAEAVTNKARAIARAQMTRSGHVYIISNIGSFGEHVYKIGMTRRLDPYERIRELGDASVPFTFDVHAVIYCDDAPSLENKLHRVFHGRRVNRVNERKEFFAVDIAEIAKAVEENQCGIELTLAAEAREYRKTQAILEEERRRPAAPAIAGDAPHSTVVAAEV